MICGSETCVTVLQLAAMTIMVAQQYSVGYIESGEL